jgi:hypothetical protein
VIIKEVAIYHLKELILCRGLLHSVNFENTILHFFLLHYVQQNTLKENTLLQTLMSRFVSLWHSCVNASLHGLPVLFSCVSWWSFCFTCQDVVFCLRFYVLSVCVLAAWSACPRDVSCLSECHACLPKAKAKAKSKTKDYIVILKLFLIRPKQYSTWQKKIQAF